MQIRPPVLVFASVLVLTDLAGAALAQVAPPPAPGLEAAVAPPPPPGHGAPPPPPGAHVIVDRGANGVVHVDVKCADRESTRDCAGIALLMLDKIGADGKSR